MGEDVRRISVCCIALCDFRIAGGQTEQLLQRAVRRSRIPISVRASVVEFCFSCMTRVTIVIVLITVYTFLASWMLRALGVIAVISGVGSAVQVTQVTPNTQQWRVDSRRLCTYKVPDLKAISMRPNETTTSLVDGSCRYRYQYHYHEYAATALA